MAEADVQEQWATTWATGRVGVCAVGHSVYWPQFDGLRERLLAHVATFVGTLRARAAATIVPTDGLCDTTERAVELGDALARERLDLLIVYVATYAPSAHVLPVIRRCGAPVLLVGLQPAPALDYERATIALQLEHDNVTSLPEIAGAMERANLAPLDVVVGTLHDDERAWARIASWCRVATVAHELGNARIGLMGHVYEGMLDMNTDPTAVEAAFGAHVEHLEMDDLAARVEGVTDAELACMLGTIQRIFRCPAPGADPIARQVQPDDLVWPARVACGMNRLVADLGLTGLAYYYRGLDRNLFERLHAGMIIGNSLITSRGVPCAGEADLKTCLAMLIMSRFGAGGSFAEFHPVDFTADLVLVGHDGPHHLLVAEGQPSLRLLSLFHGKRGSGPSVEYQIREGPITMLGLTQRHDGSFRLVVAEGESLHGPIPATGNTNTRARFQPDVRTFLERWTLAGPTHHLALGVGHVADDLGRLARLLGIECLRVA